MQRARKLTDIDLIVIHCADTPNGRWHDVIDVDLWHHERGFARALPFRQRQNPLLRAVGYHFVIYTNGGLATGRHLEEVGAHVRNHNRNSIAICLIGRDAYSPEQWKMLAANIRGLQSRFPRARICGHSDLDAGKTCPGFDVAAWLEHQMSAPQGHVLAEGEYANSKPNAPA